MLSVLGLFIFLAIGSIPSIFIIDASSENNLSSYDLEFSAVSWDPSDYINFTASLVDAGGSQMFRIFIDDNDLSRNWSVYAQNYTWCTGSGIASDPYVIENLYINGEGAGGMIFVKNSDKFFIIRDCWFNFSGPNASDVGVLIQFSSNGVMVNNSFTYTSKGVSIMHTVSDVIIDNNIFISNHTTAGLGNAIGIHSQSSNIIVSNNKIRNYYDAMISSNCNNLTISRNYFENNIFTTQTILLFNNVNDSEIVWNVFAGSFALSSVFNVRVDGGQGNTIINNAVGAGDPWVFGPETAGAFLDTPQLSQALDYPIWLLDCTNNLVANNVLHGFIDQGGTIPGFDVFIIIEMLGLITVVSLLLKRRRL